MGGYLSSDYDSRINDLEERLKALEKPQVNQTCVKSADVSVKNIPRPSWHAMIKELHKRRKSIDGEKWTLKTKFIFTNVCKANL